MNEELSQEMLVALAFIAAARKLDAGEEDPMEYWLLTYANEEHLLSVAICLVGILTQATSEETCDQLALAVFNHK